MPSNMAGEESGEVPFAHRQGQISKVIALADQDIKGVELHLVVVLLPPKRR